MTTKKTVYTHFVPTYTVAVYESTEHEVLDAALNALRTSQRPVEAETADLACNISFEDWKTLYSPQNEPGFYERYGFSY